MRVFWALIAVLILAAGAVFAMRRGDAPAISPAISDGPGPDRASLPTPTPSAAPAPNSTKAAPPGDSTPAATDAALDSALRDAANDAGVKVELPAPPAVATAAPASDATEAAKPTPTDPKPTAPAEVDPLGDTGTTPAAALLDLPALPVGVAVTREDDGSLLLDHRFVVRGEGTVDKPYEVAWDFLVSASETYKPRLGQKKLPDWLELINNKHVRITGFVAFPIMAQSPDEMLVMLNQWDGCCIGVPPTPYDAVEIKLQNAVRGDDHLKTFGTVEGLFSVDPYLVKDWLIGLYVMKDAKLSNTTGAQTSPHLTKPQP